jgi:predicted dehydrogenase
MTLSSKVRVGIIGAGGIAQGAHIPGYKKILDRVELVAISDVQVELAKARGAEHGFAQVYGSYEEMLQKAELDCVSICTPNKFHAPAALAACRRASMSFARSRPP